MSFINVIGKADTSEMEDDEGRRLPLNPASQNPPQQQQQQQQQVLAGSFTTSSSNFAPYQAQPQQPQQQQQQSARQLNYPPNHQPTSDNRSTSNPSPTPAPQYAYPSWLTENQCETPPPPEIVAAQEAAYNQAAQRQQQQRQQQQQQKPTLSPRGSNNDFGYLPMNNEEPNSLRQYEPNSSSTRTTTTIDSTSGCSSANVAQWFALETTDEDKLSSSILWDELKDVVLEVFHFLKNRNWKKKLLTVLVATASCGVMYDLMFHNNIRDGIDKFLLWMTDYPTAAEFVFMGIYILATILFIPPSLLWFGGGWAFSQAWNNNIYMGVLAATFSCFFGSVIGSLLSFVRARYMMRDLIELFSKRYPIVKAADQALKRDGLRIMFLLRLCPLIPFHGLNYLGGITGVSWKTFMISLIGILPYQVMIIIMGATAGALHAQSQMSSSSSSSEAETAAAANYANDEENDSASDYYESMEDQELQHLILLIVTSVGVATFFIAMILAFRFTKKELQKELNIGDGDIGTYIRTVRRMSMIDLYEPSYRNSIEETEDGMEVIKPDSTEFHLHYPDTRSSRRPNQSHNNRRDEFIAMETSRLDDD